MWLPTALTVPLLVQVHPSTGYSTTIAAAVGVVAASIKTAGLECCSSFSNQPGSAVAESFDSTAFTEVAVIAEDQTTAASSIGQNSIATTTVVATGQCCPLVWLRATDSTAAIASSASKAY